MVRAQFSRQLHAFDPPRHNVCVSFSGGRRLSHTHLISFSFCGNWKRAFGMFITISRTAPKDIALSAHQTHLAINLNFCGTKFAGGLNASPLRFAGKLWAVWMWIDCFSVDYFFVCVLFILIFFQSFSHISLRNSNSVRVCCWFRLHFFMDSVPLFHGLENVFHEVLFVFSHLRMLSPKIRQGAKKVEIKLDTAWTKFVPFAHETLKPNQKPVPSESRRSWTTMWLIRTVESCQSFAYPNILPPLFIQRILGI